jgi:hypothetical protein
MNRGGQTEARAQVKGPQIKYFFLEGVIFWFFSFNLHYSTLVYLPPLRFHRVGECWDRIQDCCDFGIDSQTL